MEIKRPDGSVVLVPGCARFDGSDNEHCLLMWQCRNGRDCRVGVNRHDLPAHIVDSTPGQRMDGGVPSRRE